MAQPQARLDTPQPRRTRSAPELKVLQSQFPTLWKAMILTSFLLNLVLFAVVVALLASGYLYGQKIIGTTTTVQTFARANIVELREVVANLNEADIVTTIALNQDLPLRGAGITVPVDQVTVVTLQEPVPLNLAGADIDLGNGNRLRANNISLVLPQGTPLKIALKMDIPLDDVVIPVKLDVPVNIPLKDTELGPEFRKLGAIVDRLVLPFTPFLGMEEQPPTPVAQP
ncbi:MAG: hypothetical protein H7Z42_23680 [Roseiflexaceae bacterium]|nr:hypothetical protein [Roseiflexaceae bacterium]